MYCVYSLLQSASTLSLKDAHFDKNTETIDSELIIRKQEAEEWF